MRPPAPKLHICINIILRSVGNVAPQSIKSVGGFATIGMKPSWIHIKQIYTVLMVCRDQNTLLRVSVIWWQPRTTCTATTPEDLPSSFCCSSHAQEDGHQQPTPGSTSTTPQIPCMSLETLTKFYHFLLGDKFSSLQDVGVMLFEITSFPASACAFLAHVTI